MTKKGFIKSIAGFFAGLLCLSAVTTSCERDKTLLYNNITMGNVVEGQYVTDNGNIFNVVEKYVSVSLDTLNRVYTICDILNHTEGGKSNEYDVRLKMYIEPLVKAPYVLTQMSQEQIDKLGKDPIKITSAWFSGGYLNLQFTIEYKEGSAVEHPIYLVYDDEHSTGDVLYLYVYHDAKGESLKNGYSSAILTGTGFASFPMAGIIDKDASRVDFSLTWNWYQNDTPSSDGLIKEYGASIAFIKGQFESSGIY